MRVQIPPGVLIVMESEPGRRLGLVATECAAPAVGLVSSALRILIACTGFGSGTAWPRP